MGDIGARQVRYEVLPTSAPPEHVEPQVPAADREEAAPDRLAARAEPARR